MPSKQIVSGLKNKLTRIVKRTDTALHYGTGSLEVLATPAIIKYMEQTAFQLMEPLLTKSETTVGISIHLEHTYAAMIDEEFTCFAELVKTENKKYSFRIEARNVLGKTLGTATHIRYLIDEKQFMSKLAK